MFLRTIASAAPGVVHKMQELPSHEKVRATLSKGYGDFQERGPYRGASIQAIVMIDAEPRVVRPKTTAATSLTDRWTLKYCSVVHTAPVRKKAMCR